ncbi:MAG: homoserine dehydrogenase [Humidesulfovibrio sp.]|uniref:homoserine dehydrogenase n=1 Tax=Humidesulfovibrio sp. TaxID=2910988 RepID=UPI00273688B9|nr:homoserine dehydrogenase [Humidesulfovibrio sp.]MDP2848614.1 homoserine dehydrogenase [Humidesulfovibrio sp.]
MNTLRLGIAGFGTVGSGLAQILHENREIILARTGRDIAITTVLVRDLSKKRAAATGPEVRFTNNPDDLLSNEVDVVVELMGGVDLARDLITRALQAGKHVVTANKHLLALHGPELSALAASKGLGLFYEASVAGGVPIVQALRESLGANRIERLTGIMNGTANYILSEMTTNHLEFATALKQAQDLGYAEADPTFDIEGFDTAHKLVVLIRLAYGRDFPLSRLPVRGITQVTGLDIEFAREFGYRIKLLAQAREVDGKIEASVEPTLVKHTFLLARVGGNYNAVRVEGNAVGPIMLHGQGAGALPTGSAVMADIMALCRGLNAPCASFDNTGFGNKPLPQAEILPASEGVAMHYFRFTVTDRPGVLASIAKTMAEHDISIAQAVQKGDHQASDVPIVFLTHNARASAVADTIRIIDAMPFTLRPTVHFPIL